MSHLDKLQQIWSSDEVKDLAVVVSEALQLLELAHESHETVPIKLEVEILLAANYTLSFGGAFEESQWMFKVLKPLVDDRTQIEEKVLQRFGCTAINSVLAIMTSDTSQGTRKANQILSEYGITSTSTRSQILTTLLDIALSLVNLKTTNTWNLELVSYIITLYTMLEVFDELTVDTSSRVKFLASLFDREWDETSEKNIRSWKSDWLKKSDYFRFILLMISNKHAEEDQWVMNAAKITKLNTKNT